MDFDDDDDVIVVASSPARKPEPTKNTTKTFKKPAQKERKSTPVIKKEGTPAPAVITKKAAAPKEPRRVTEHGRHDHAKEMDIDGKSVKEDLEDFGFGKKRVNDMMKWKDVQDIHVSGAKARENSMVVINEMKARDKSQRTGKAKAKTGGSSYEPLSLAEGTNWVLFDPEKGYPSAFHDEPITKFPPAIFQRFETYQPGNARIVEFNVESGAVRLRSTPQILVAKEIRYEKTGPKLVDILPQKKGKTVKDKKAASGLKTVVNSSDVEDGLSEAENRGIEVADDDAYEE